MIRLIIDWRCLMWTMVLACLLSCKHTEEPKTSGANSTPKTHAPTKALWTRTTDSDPRANAAAEKKTAPVIPETSSKTIQSNSTSEGLQTSKGKMSKALDKEIDARFDNVTLEQIILKIGQAEGIQFVADISLPAFQQKLSVNAKSMRLSDFLAYVERNMGVQFHVGNDVIWITDAKELSEIQRRK